MKTVRPTFSFFSPRALQISRTRMFVPGSDPLFSTRSRTDAARHASRLRAPREAALNQPRLFTPGLVDRLQSPLTRYFE